MTSSEKYEELEEELKALYEDVNTKILHRIPKLSGEKKKLAIREVEKQIEDANIMIEDMELEAGHAPGAYRNPMTSRVRSYKRDFEKLRKDLGKPSGGPRVTFGREELFDSNPESDQKFRVNQATESLNRTSESIARSTRVAVETEQIGGEIIEDLGDQRESLIRTRDRLKETHQDLGRSRRILNSMAIRVATNKLLLLMIIVVELAILGAVVYLKFFKK
ncbi:vesicle transport through interaction with t-SNAREs homolog 1B [Exaiptasia diaphana]|uniref:t-SNARE coiled-coil homology domain-containing protein n=1 Tax=Exaiptasia diaphana TaxID=2652724 RepID=A0A913X7H0_EXADI|nr:vesicle transport through interaction with t-SNAREs homolog 1B [Exaiptasia diaphana]KXJ14439.1 Vesicle transport through interaction with t-SNAREs-like 1B [Exaiptasia diaphana]